MIYETEHIASALRGARESKGLSQRELSEKSGVPQSHISKIETGAVDLRVSTLVALARGLDMELSLVPRKAVSAVQSIIRGSARGPMKDSEAARQSQRELARIQKTIASLLVTTSSEKVVAQLRRQVRELQSFQLAMPDIEALRAANKATKVFRNDTKNLEPIRQAILQLRRLRNALAHSSVNMTPQIASPRPVYSLDEDDHG